MTLILFCFNSAIIRASQGRSVSVPRGPKRRLSDELLAKITKRAAIKDLSKDSYTKQTFAKKVDKLLSKEAANGKSIIAGLPNKYGHATLIRGMKKALPETAKVTTANATRRIEAASDPFNHMSLAATWPALITNDDVTDLCEGYGHVNRRLLFNIDCTNVFVGDDSAETVFMAEGSKEKLKRLNLSAGTAKESEETEQRRSVQLMALTCAEGDWYHVTVKIRDNLIKRLMIRAVSATVCAFLCCVNTLTHIYFYRYQTRLLWLYTPVATIPRR